MNEAEIIASFKNALNKRLQVQILAELNAVRKDDILLILKKHGLYNGQIPMPKRKYVRNGAPKPKEENKPRQPHLDELLHNKLLKLYKAGKSDTDIALILHISYSTVYTWRRKNNLPKHIKQSMKQQIYDLYDIGYSDRLIASALNISTQYVGYCRYLKGLKPNPKGALLVGR